MEFHDIGKRGLKLDTGDPMSPLSVAVAFREIIIERNDSLLKIQPMMAHILANTICGMMKQGLTLGDVAYFGVTTHVLNKDGVIAITVAETTVKFPAAISTTFVEALCSLIPVEDLHWLPPGKVAIFLEPDNGIVPAHAGEACCFLPPPSSLLVPGDNFCGCDGGISSLDKCSPRCQNCLAIPSYKEDWIQFYKYGGHLPFFARHPMCNGI